MVEVRAALEAEAAYLAAQRREPEDLVAMEEAIAEMEAALRTGDLAAEADWKFHHAIATASGNGVLLQIMRSLSETMQESIVRFRTGLLRIPGMDTVLLAEHQGILDAIRDRDAKLAHDRMRAHLDRVRQMLYGELSATANEQQR
nr:FCD domain-containing protein [Symbiobacterium terraclitae]